MKVIFLDIDGVLNFCGSATFDSGCISELKHIIAETGAKLVLSSSWKEAISQPENSSEMERRTLRLLLDDPELPFIGITPDIAPDDRGKEVQAWLDAAPEMVESFVILDDIDYEFPEKFPNNFVKTAGFTGRGLTSVHASRAIQILTQDVEGSPHLP